MNGKITNNNWKWCYYFLDINFQQENVPYYIPGIPTRMAAPRSWFRQTQVFPLVSGTLVTLAAPAWWPTLCATAIGDTTFQIFVFLCLGTSIQQKWDQINGPVWRSSTFEYHICTAQLAKYFHICVRFLILISWNLSKRIRQSEQSYAPWRWS